MSRYPRAASVPPEHEDIVTLVGLEHRVAALEAARERSSRFNWALLGLLTTLILAIGGAAWSAHNKLAERIIEVDKQSAERIALAAARAADSAAGLTTQLARIDERLAALQWRLSASPTGPGRVEPGRSGAP